jgi:hypothetical protein
MIEYLKEHLQELGKVSIDGDWKQIQEAIKELEKQGYLTKFQSTDADYLVLIEIVHVYKLIVCNMGYSSCIEEINGKTSTSINELIGLVMEYIDEETTHFEDEEILLKRFKITDNDFNDDGIAFVIEMPDPESSIYIRKA